MAGLTEKAGGDLPEVGAGVERAHQTWEASMLEQNDRLRVDVLTRSPEEVAQRSGGNWTARRIQLRYWGQQVSLGWPDLEAHYETDGSDCSVFDTAVLLYYLHTADGAPLAWRWIGYRELPDGAFYANAFQGYSGDRMAKEFGERPEAFAAAAGRLGGVALEELPGLAYAFQPLPCIRLASVLYPGDEEFPARGAVLFDAAASHYLPTDGLALLGSGVVGRLVKAARK